LENLARHVFGDVEMRWNADYFPFTDPSFELEVFYNNEWLEILGSGVLTDSVMKNANIDPN
jgi:phenylalanyl-tRNA synthetase alpha chain